MDHFLKGCLRDTEVLTSSFTGWRVINILLFQAETAFLQKAVSLIEAEYVEMLH